jgi:putative Holliday junction resolvase
MPTSAATRIYLGFDFGLRRIGVAAGQAITASSTSVASLGYADGEPDWNVIAQIVKEWQPDALVVGIPVHLDGAKQPLTAAAQNFAQALASRFGLPVHTTDERLSSVEAKRILKTDRAAGARRKTRRGDVDKIAACVILQAWLQHRKTQND